MSLNLDFISSEFNLSVEGIGAYQFTSGGTDSTRRAPHAS